MISCAIAFIISLDCLLIPFVFFFPTAVGFCSVLVCFFFLTTHKPMMHPFPCNSLTENERVSYHPPTQLFLHRVSWGTSVFSNE